MAITDSNTAMTIEVKGLKKLQAGNERVIASLGRSGYAVAQMALIIERQAKINATGRPGPMVQTGRLRASITTEVESPDLARVGTNVDYAADVEYGHSQQVGRFIPIYGMRALNAYSIANHKRVYEAVGGFRLVNPFAPAYPFMSPTIEQTVGDREQLMVKYGKDIEVMWA